MSALWVHEVADRFWHDAGGAPSGFPRELLDPLCWALPVVPFEVPGLSVDRANAWLTEHGFGLRLEIPDRPLRACLLVQEGSAVLFVDADDPEDERRFSMAHEIAHYLIEYDDPRRKARERLGGTILPVLDGRRSASWDERVGALLGGVTLTARLHLMERTADGHLPGREVSAAERHADALAFELLAPFDAVRARLTDRAERSHVEAVLRQTFGLPPAPARVYAARLSPEPPAGSLFRRLFAIS